MQEVIEAQSSSYSLFLFCLGWTRPKRSPRSRDLNWPTLASSFDTSLLGCTGTYPPFLHWPTLGAFREDKFRKQMHFHRILINLYVVRAFFVIKQRRKLGHVHANAPNFPIYFLCAQKDTSLAVSGLRRSFLYRRPTIVWNRFLCYFY